MTADQDDYADYDEPGECFQCGGEGFVYGCGWGWQCDTYDEGEGTCLCTRRCDVCQPMTDAEKAEREALRKIIADALADNGHRELRLAHKSPCSMGVGCDEYGVCYAEAHGSPEQCPKPKAPTS